MLRAPSSNPIFFPSDALPVLRQLLIASDSSTQALAVPALRVVIDANCIRRELRWLHTKRRSRVARSTFRELVDSGVVVPYAPPLLEQEVTAQFTDLHERDGIPMESLHSSWTEYRGLLKWVAPREARQSQRLLRRLERRDPKDQTYAALAIQIGAAGILTFDRDFEATDLPSYDESVLNALRVHARAGALELGAIASGSAAISVCAGLSRELWQGFRRLPVSAQIVLAGLAIGGVFFALKGRRIRTKTELVWQFAGPLVEPLTSARSARLREPIGHLTNRTPLSLVDYLVVICAEAQEPLPLKELTTRAITAGFRTSALRLPCYVRRVISRDRRFIQRSRHRWALRKAVIVGTNSAIPTP